MFRFGCANYCFSLQTTFKTSKAAKGYLIESKKTTWLKHAKANEKKDSDVFISAPQFVIWKTGLPHCSLKTKAVVAIFHDLKGQKVLSIQVQRQFCRVMLGATGSTYLLEVDRATKSTYL